MTETDALNLTHVYAGRTSTSPDGTTDDPAQAEFFMTEDRVLDLCARHAAEDARVFGITDPIRVARAALEILKHHDALVAHAGWTIAGWSLHPATTPGLQPETPEDLMEALDYFWSDEASGHATGPLGAHLDLRDITGPGDDDGE